MRHLLSVSMYDCSDPHRSEQWLPNMAAAWFARKTGTILPESPSS